MGGGKSWFCAWAEARKGPSFGTGAVRVVQEADAGRPRTERDECSTAAGTVDRAALSRPGRISGLRGPRCWGLR